MSIALMTLTWQTALPLNQKAALLALSDWANDEGVCSPTVQMLATRLSCSERTIQRILSLLKRDGWIKVVSNSSGGRPGIGCSYQVQLAAPAVGHEKKGRAA